MVLWILFLFVWIAAKIDFFTHYGKTDLSTYLQHHAIYWIAMAAVGFAAWLIEKLWAKD